MRSLLRALPPLLLPALLTACPAPAGPDAGTSPDAGPDGGTGDGGPTDGGSGDGGPGDGGPGDGGPGDGGAGDAGSADGGPSYDNESCQSAAPLEPGISIQGSNADTGNDHTGSCANPGGADLVYAVTLEEPSGLEVTATGYDIVLYVTEGGCDAASELPDGCVDTSGDGEHLAFSLLDAGTYFIVVDSFSDGFGGGGGDAFVLDVAVTPGGVCLNDALDQAAPNDAPETATALGGMNLDSRNLQPSAPEPEPLDLILCEGEEDWYWVEHMGGTFGLEGGLVEGAGAHTLTLYAATGSVDVNGQVALTPGAELGTAPFAAELGRGVYLLKAAATSVRAVGDRYFGAVTHGCQADVGDHGLPALDDDDLEHARVQLHAELEAPLERRLCAGDVDTVLLQASTASDITLRLAGAAGLTTTVEEVLFVDGARTVAPYAGHTTATEGDDLVLGFPAAAAGAEYLVTTAPPAVLTDEVVYTIEASFERQAPANDTCGAAQALADVGAQSPGVVGFTTGGTHTFASACNFDQGAPDPAPEVFYTFSLPERVDTEIRYDGTPYEGSLPFWAGLSVFRYPGMCPSDLDDLEPVLAPDPILGDGPVCRFGDLTKVRLPELNAGEYLVVVDGEAGLFGEPAEGSFHLRVRAYPDGWPVPLACTEATEQALPALGQQVSFAVDTRPGRNDLESSDYPCLGYGADGKERAIRLAPSEDMKLSVETSPGFDTVLVLREGDCAEGREVIYDPGFGGEWPACSDDSEAGTNAKLEEIPLAAGHVYYLLVDGGFGASGQTTVTLTTSAP